MAGAFATKTLKDAANNSFTQRVWDESGTGAGPFQPVTVLATSAGVEVDPATSGNQTTLLSRVPAALGQTTKSGSLPVAIASDQDALTIKGNIVTLVDKSGTLTTGGTAQSPIASNSSRRGFMIQNQSAGDLWFNTLATAIQGQPSIRLSPGDFYETPAHAVPTGAVSIIGATTGQAFAAREW